MENTGRPNAVQQRGTVQSVMEDNLMMFSEGEDDLVKDTDLSPV